MRIFKIKPKRFNKTVWILQACFIMLALVLVLKLIELQLVDPRQLKEKAIHMRTSKAFVFRGEIVDRNGLKLATDGSVYDVYAHPQYFDKETTPADIARLIAPVLKLDKKKLTEKLSQNYSTITIMRGIDRDKMLELRKLKIGGLDIAKRNIRVYPQGLLASHILGYVNPDAKISAGVEHTGSRLVEKVKSRFLQKDGHGRVIFDFGTNPEEISKPIKGEKLVLTIDSAIQHVAEKELAKMIDATDAERGTVIVMNPRSGEILAMAVLPSYDPNEYNKYDYSVVKNWVLSDVYPPGSTFKIITVASALNTGKMSKYDTVYDSGTIKIEGWPIENYDYKKFPCPGDIDLPYLLEHSSNV
ncbi:MAG: penicillin-binding transpeptidase domain-containing protein, partial [Candidatus Gastranaerophilales bacterium]|nr:penicillin-binding transpeptidase domain-containing protein [Candidatus Gastranaerophilales bacterium]